MNYAEEAAYWYLRLNGFFPITNFVIHRGDGRDEHPSDCDVIGVRPPFVYEEIGGREDDWDPFLTAQLTFAEQIGIICEVKSGACNPALLFRPRSLKYSVERLGLVEREELDRVANDMEDQSVLRLRGGTQLVKLLVTRERCDGPWLTRTLPEVHDFLRDRAERYLHRKHGDRIFFGSGLFQTIIEIAKHG